MSIETIVDFNTANTEAERFRPAPEKVLKGDPEQVIHNHYDSPCGQMNAGVWEGAVVSGRLNTPNTNTVKSCRAFQFYVTGKVMPKP